MRIKYIIPFPFDAEGIANRAAQIPRDLLGPADHLINCGAQPGKSNSHLEKLPRSRNERFHYWRFDGLGARPPFRCRRRAVPFPIKRR